MGIDRDPRLVEAAKRRVAHLPCVDVVQADALGYEADESFDAVHCRLVPMHQHAPDAFLAHLIALTRPGGRVAVQEYDLDGLPCFPAFGSFERMIDAGLSGRSSTSDLIHTLGGSCSIASHVLSWAMSG